MVRISNTPARLWLAIVVVCVVAGLAICHVRKQAQQARAEELYAAAMSENTRERVEILQEALELQPADKRTQAALVTALWWEGQAHEVKAIAATARRAEEAAKVAKGSGMLWGAAAYHWANAGDREAAMRCAQNALRAGNLNAEAHLGVAKAFYLHGDFASSLQHSIKALSVAGLAKEAAWLAIRTGALAGQPDVALEAMRRLSSEHQNNLIAAHVAAGEYDEAVSQAEQCLEHNDIALMRNAVASAAYAALCTGDHKRATSLLNHLWPTHSPPLPHGWLLDAVIACDMGEYGMALGLVRTALWGIFHPHGPQKELALLDGPISEPAIPTIEDLWQMVLTRASRSDTEDAKIIAGCAHAMLGEERQARITFAQTSRDEPAARIFLETGSLSNWVNSERFQEARRQDAELLRGFAEKSGVKIPLLPTAEPATAPA